MHSRQVWISAAYCTIVDTDAQTKVQPQARPGSMIQPKKEPSSEHRIVQFHQPESRRVRLRRAVRAADRPPRARFERVLGDRPVRHHRRRGARDGARRHHPVRRPRLRQRRGRSARRPRHLRAGRADPGLLLRPSGDLRHLGRQRVPPRGRRVRSRRRCTSPAASCSRARPPIKPCG